MHCILFFCRCLFGKWIDGMSPLFCIYICWEYARQTQRWAANELSNQKVIHWDVVWKNVSRFPGQETSCASAIINLIISWIQFRAMWNMFFYAALLRSSSGRTRTVESWEIVGWWENEDFALHPYYDYYYWHVKVSIAFLFDCTCAVRISPVRLLFFTLGVGIGKLKKKKWAFRICRTKANHTCVSTFTKCGHGRRFSADDIAGLCWSRMLSAAIQPVTLWINANS